MAERKLFVSVEIKGGDKAAKTFKEIGTAATSSAKTMESSAKGAAKSIDQIDKAAGSAESAVKELAQAEQQAATAAGKLDQSNAKAARSLKDFEGAGRQLGAGLGLIGASFAVYSQQVVENERNIAALGRTYGEAAGQFVALADQIQATTIFSNDEAVAAANTMGTLARNYGLTADQIEQLIVVSADLAAVNGTTLADASQRVAAAIRGEAESAETLGLTMNQAAIDSEGLTLSMTNAEAGTFRFNALMEQSAFATGAAGEQADTTAGQVQQLSNRFQDAMQSAVSFTGPLGSVAAGLGSFGLEAGLAVTGLVQLVRGVSTAATAMGGFAALVGPVGIVVAIGAAVYAAIELSNAMQSQLEPSFDETQDSAAELDTTIGQLAATMGDKALALDLLEGLDDIESRREELEKLKAALDTVNNPQYPQGLPPGASPEAQAAFDAYIANYQSAQQVVEQFGITEEGLIASNNRVAEAQDAYNTILTNTGVGAEAAMQTTANLFNQFERGEITFDQLVDSLNGVVADLGNYDAAAIEAAAATQELAAQTIYYTEAQKALRSTTFDLMSTEEARTQAAKEGHAAMEAALLTTSRAYQEVADAAQEANQAELESNLLGRSRAYHELAAAAKEAAEAERDANLAAIAAAANDALFPFEDLALSIRDTANAFDGLEQSARGDALVAYEAKARSTAEAVGLLDDAVEQLRANGTDTVGINLAIDTGNANEVLNSTFSAVVGGAQGFAQSTQAVADWSAGLAHGMRMFTALDQLVIDGQISYSTYTDALDANHRIQQANNDVQEDSLRIQAKQLPLMADLAEQQAAYIDSLADASAEEQLIALSYMDSATAAQALSLAQLAAASTTDGMQASTAAMIEQLALADPMLAAILEDMGLISVTDGKVTVNFDDAVSAAEATQELTGVMREFIEVISQVFGIDIDDSSVGPARDNVQGLTIDLNNVPRSVVTQLLAIDMVSPAVSSALQSLGMIDGKRVTTYIDTVSTSVNLDKQGAYTGGTFNGFALGGTILPELPRGTLDGIPAYAGGGTHAIVGEVGRELVWLPNGSQVTPHGATESRLSAMDQGGGSGGITFNGPVTLQPNGSDAYTAIRRAALSRKRGIA